MLIRMYRLSRYGVPDNPTVREAVAMSVLRRVRSSARRKKQGSRFWNNVAKSVAVAYAKQSLVVKAMHPAARIKETGGTITAKSVQAQRAGDYLVGNAGRFRSSGRYTKMHRRRSGAKWLRIPIHPGQTVPAYQRLEWRPPKGSYYTSQKLYLRNTPTHKRFSEHRSDALHVKLGHTGGRWILGGNGDNRGVLGYRKDDNDPKSFVGVYFLRSRVRVGPDKWYPSRRLIVGAIRHGMSVGFKNLVGKQKAKASR